MAKGKYEYWLTPEGLLKLEGWARDGLTDEQIAENMGINKATLYRWKEKYCDICDTLKRGKEVVDLQVENALLNSKAGWKGVLKKLGYWIMIAVAFGASAVFVEIGKTIGVDLGITTLLGWFVLASLLVNEIRSICENFVEAGYNVPQILIRGLEVADKAINKEADTDSEGE